MKNGVTLKISPTLVNYRIKKSLDIILVFSNTIL